MSNGLARSELTARPGRYLWLLVAVTVAVSFTVGAFGFSTQLTSVLAPSVAADAGFDTLPEGSVVITANTDAVTSATALGESLLAEVRAIPGVAIAEGSYDQPVSFRLRTTQQPERPVILRGVLLSSTYTPQRWQLIEGRAPEGPDEIAVDLAGLAVSHRDVGDSPRLELPTGVRRMEIVGLVSGANEAPVVESPIVALASAHVVLDPAVAPVLLDAAGKVDRITVTPTPGTDVDALAADLTNELPSGLEITSSLNRAAVTQHTVERIDEGVRAAVLGFASLTVLISSLVVANTLSVLVAQRTREFGLMRLIGASRAQVLRSVLVESTIIGALGAGIGFVAGIGLAKVAARFVQTGGSVDLIATPTMAAVAVIVGLGVTTVGAMLPAVRAGRVAPIAALSDTRAGAERPPRLARSALLLAVGVGLGFVGSRTASDSIAGVGIVIAFVGIAGLSRWVVRPLLGMIDIVTGPVGSVASRLAIGNARRQPARTAGAASTLMVGLALVGLVATIGASIRSTVATQFDTASTADLYLERRGVVRVSSDQLEFELQERFGGGLTYVSIRSLDGVLVGDQGTVTSSGSRLSELAVVADLGIISGSLTSSPDTTNVALSSVASKKLDVGVGDALALRSVSGTETPLRVTAVYANTALVGDAVVDLSGEVESNALGTFELGLVRFDGFEGYSDRRLKREVDDIATRYPKVRVHTPTEFGALNTSVTDTVLRIVGVVLVGMVGIGYLGLVATLGLSTLERRRELTMLRAIGAERSQIREMVGLEAVLIGLMAAVIGLSLGVVGGSVGASIIADDLIARTVIPWPIIIGLGVVSVALSAGVSLGVARRASFVPPAEAGR